MASYDACPHCGREAKEAFTSNWFPIYKCSDCGELYCKECGGDECPECGSERRVEVGKVYA